MTGNNFTPRFKEGSLVKIEREGIVTEVMLGRDEEDTWYNVFISRGDIGQYQSKDVLKRKRKTNALETN